jgi:hypothetical protein
MKKSYNATIVDLQRISNFLDLTDGVFSASQISEELGINYNKVVQGLLYLSSMPKVKVRIVQKKGSKLYVSNSRMDIKGKLNVAIQRENIPIEEDMETAIEEPSILNQLEELKEVVEQNE